jgi:hypothetical protein
VNARQSKGRRTASPKDTPAAEIEIEPGAWERFKSAVHKMARPKAAKPFRAASKKSAGASKGGNKGRRKD